MKFLWLAVFALSLCAAPSANDLARQIRETGLDPQECYRVRDLQFSKEDARFYLNSGLLIFLKPIEGRRIAAIFSAEVQAGDAEILLIPPTRGERASLASFTKSPNLDEHFRSSLFLFTDDTAEELLKQIRGNEFNQKSAEEGFLLASQWDSVLHNLSSSFEVRLIEDLLSKRSGQNGFFFATMSGRELGNFDFIADPRSRQQVTLGQIVNRENRTYYDLWTHFSGQSFRKGKRILPEPDFKITDYRIEARLTPDLHLDVVTRINLIPSRTGFSLPFELSQRMRVTAVEVDGTVAEVFRRESFRSNLLRGDQNEVFLVTPVTPLEPGKTHEIVVHHDGDVIGNAGNNVYFVGARINWYPRRGNEFARFDLIFRYPKNLGLVASGDLIGEKIEGDEKIAHRRSSVPVRYAGFNLGDYAKASASRGGYQVDLYANRKLEVALEPKIQHTLPLPSPFPRRRPGVDLDTMLTPPPSPNPLARLEQMAGEIAAEYEWMATKLGPPPQKTLAVSPIPGQFGQGFAGLLYLSTLAYVDMPHRIGASAETQAYFSNLLHAHETAHQWWGNSIASAGYEDDWLQEAMANYLALLVLEKKRGTRAMDEILSEFRKRLLNRDDSGQLIDGLGPVTFGVRLQNSQSPAAWRTIIYDKGSWIIHMLRRRLGDDLFWGLIGDLARRYQYQQLSTQLFRDAAVEFLSKQSTPSGYRTMDPKLESFFETWAYGTGIPSLKLNWSVKGASPKVVLTGTVSQSDVPEDFTDVVPVEIQFARGKSVTKWVRTSSEPVTFTVNLPSPPLRVQLDPANAVLKR